MNKTVLLLGFLFIPGFVHTFEAQQNRFEQSQGSAGISNTDKWDYNTTTDSEVPGDPDPYDDPTPVPVDDYIPFLFIIAVVLLASTYRRKGVFSNTHSE